MSRTLHVVGGKPAENSETFHWDEEVPQLAERRRGSIWRWIVQTRVNGRTKRRTFGDRMAIPIEVAREMARAWLDEVLATSSVLDKRTTLAEFAPRFLEDCAGQWKPATLRSHGLGLEKQILPHLGDVRVVKLAREDVIAWQTSLTYSPATVNRALVLVAVVFSPKRAIENSPP